MYCPYVTYYFYGKKAGFSNTSTSLFLLRKIKQLKRMSVDTGYLSANKTLDIKGKLEPLVMSH